MLLNNCSGEHGVSGAVHTVQTSWRLSAVGAELHPAARERTEANRLL